MGAEAIIEKIRKNAAEEAASIRKQGEDRAAAAAKQITDAASAEAEEILRSAKASAADVERRERAHGPGWRPGKTPWPPAGRFWTKPFPRLWTS